MSNVDPASHVPPVLTKTWFHTGAFVDVGASLSQRYAAEYWREPGLTERRAGRADAARTSTPAGRPLLLADGTRLPYRPDTEELREACRALKGSTLRQEVYAIDGSAEQDRPYQVSETTLRGRAAAAHGRAAARRVPDAALETVTITTSAGSTTSSGPGP